MLKIIIRLFLLFLLCREIQMITEKQMKSTANLLRSVCQPKSKATNAQIDNMHKGEFEDDPKPKYYMKCVLETAFIMKNSKLDYDATMKQVNSLPAKFVGPTKETVEKCKDSATNPDPFEAAYEIAKCWYFANPQYYFFP